MFPHHKGEKGSPLYGIGFPVKMGKLSKERLGTFPSRDGKRFPAGREMFPSMDGKHFPVGMANIPQ